MTAPVQPPPAAAEELEEQLADIGDRVRAERQARGWSQTQLGQRAGLALATIKRLEDGQTTLRGLLLTCAALEVDLGHVLSREWRMPARGPMLTRRQAQVLREAAGGDSLATVGSRLGMSRESAAAYLSQAYQRLGVADLPRGERRAAAVRRAAEHQLIDAA